jgi:hypothetical protein
MHGLVSYPSAMDQFVASACRYPLHSFIEAPPLPRSLWLSLNGLGDFQSVELDDDARTRVMWGPARRHGTAPARGGDGTPRACSCRGYFFCAPSLFAIVGPPPPALARRPSPLAYSPRGLGVERVRPFFLFATILPLDLRRPRCRSTRNRHLLRTRWLWLSSAAFFATRLDSSGIHDAKRPKTSPVSIRARKYAVPHRAKWDFALRPPGLVGARCGFL